MSAAPKRAAMSHASENPVQALRLAVIACGVPGATAMDWWATVVGAWPAKARPTAHFVELSSNDCRTADELIQGVSIAVVLAGGEACTRSLRRLIADLDDRSTPVLLVAKDEDAARTADASSFTAVVPIAAAAGREAIAGAAYTLLCREPAIEQVKRQLDLERAVKAAAARELDRHQTETALAVMVQRAFIPNRLPTINGLDAGVLYRPGSSLSGDMFDLVQLDEHHAGFFVADAMGHGIAAALLTMLVSRLLPMKDSTPAGERLVPPGEALRRFNSAFMQRRADDSTMVTAAYGVLDLRDGTLEIASAGHPLPMIAGREGVRPIDVGGPSAGLDADAEYESVTLTLNAGEALLMYTDGFEWAFATDERVRGLRRPNSHYVEAFAQIGRREQGLSIGDAFARLSARMDGQEGSLHQPDDITLLGLTRAPLADERALHPRLAA